MCVLLSKARRLRKSVTVIRAVNEENKNKEQKRMGGHSSAPPTVGRGRRSSRECGPCGGEEKAILKNAAMLMTRLPAMALALAPLRR